METKSMIVVFTIALLLGPLGLSGCDLGAKPLLGGEATDTARSNPDSPTPMGSQLYYPSIPRTPCTRSWLNWEVIESTETQDCSTPKMEMIQEITDRENGGLTVLLNKDQSNGFPTIGTLLYASLEAWNRVSYQCRVTGDTATGLQRVVDCTPAETLPATDQLRTFKTSSTDTALLLANLDLKFENCGKTLRIYRHFYSTTCWASELSDVEGLNYSRSIPVFWQRAQVHQPVAPANQETPIPAHN